jgi:hemin uptake protein HemP
MASLSTPLGGPASDCLSGPRTPGGPSTPDEPAGAPATHAEGAEPPCGSPPVPVPAQHPAQAATPPARARRWRSDELIGAGKEVEISHAGAVYRLRVTALGKLILTK